jgi:hypothetical protein
VKAPFRVMQPSAGFQKVAADGQPTREYFERLMKMIPAEVVGLYIVGNGLIPKERPVVLAAWTALGLFGVVAIRAWGTSDKDRKLGPQWPAVAISSVAYVIWVYSMGGAFAAYGIAEPYLGSLLVLGWTFFVPIFYKGSFE